jgi:hypothetical protein
MILKPSLGPILWYRANLRATLARHNVFLRVRTQLRSAFRGVSVIPIKPSYPFSKTANLCWCGSYLERLTSLQQPFMAALPNRLDSVPVTFDGCHMFCQMCKNTIESISPGDCCECLKSSEIEQAVVSPLTNHGLPEHGP